MAAKQTWTAQWHRDQIDRFREERPIYELYADLIREILARVCRRLSNNGYATSRAKTLASFAEKAIRKFDKYRDPVRQLTDLCGGRAVVETGEEVARIGDFIRRFFTVHEEDIEDLRQRLEIDQFGYSSMHYLVQMPGIGLRGRSFFTDLASFIPSEDAALLKESIEAVRREKRWAGYKSSLAVLHAIGERKAEIQVCTMLQHAWAAISHDRLYKSDFKAPRNLARLLHRVSALLEDADEEFARGIAELDEYRLDYGAYMNHDQMREEIKKWEAVAARDRGNAALALKVAGLAIALEDWDKVISVLVPLRNSANPDALRDLGFAKSKKGAGGRAELQEAVRRAPGDAAACCYLGDTYCSFSGTSGPRSRRGRRKRCAAAMADYARAFEAAPSDPRALSRYLECKICFDQNLDFLPLLQPALEAALDKSYRRAAVQVHVPQAFYDMGEFALLLGRPYESLGAYAKAVHLSNSEQPILAALVATDKIQHGLGRVRKKPAWVAHLEWMRRFLRLARVAKLQQLERKADKALAERRNALASAAKELEKVRSALEAADAPGRRKRSERNAAAARLCEARAAARRAAKEAREASDALDEAAEKAEAAQQEATRGHLDRSPRTGKTYPTIAGPVAIVAGGCDPRVQTHMDSYRALLVESFRGFTGTIISAGTTWGIGGIVGDIQRACGRAVRTIGYLPWPMPANMPKWIRRDKRYREIRYAPGDEHMALEPIQNWIDLLSSGIKPCDVKVLGINGGIVAAAEYRIALALGASVAVLEESGREAARLLPDEDWCKAERLMVLPAEAVILREYLASGSRKTPPELAGKREEIAREIHNAYLEARRADLLASDPAAAKWEDLSEPLKASNMQQLEHIFEKLRLIGCTWEQVPCDQVTLLNPRPREIEIMAEAEHARYVVERLLDGWKWGPKKDVEKRINPSLVGWSKLPENLRELDRNTVRRIPEFLKKACIEVQRGSNA